MSRLSTPCISYCWIDPIHGHCEGCGRTRSEIASWCFITEDERLAVMARLRARLDGLMEGGSSSLPSLDTTDADQEADAPSAGAAEADRG